MKFAAAIVLLCSAAAPVIARADDAPDWVVLGQATFVDQYHPGFHSPYRGTNSLDPGSRGNETFDATVFLGVRLWQGGEFWIDPEIDQGFGLSGTLGIAAFPSGEAYKVGSATPYGRVPEIFFRQSFALGGAQMPVETEANHLSEVETTDRLVITAGKFSVIDIFDTNIYAHDPKTDFMNWAIIDLGAFDYAADAWGYSYGLAGELTQSAVTFRAGVFDMSRIPNGPALVRGFGYYEMDGEVELRHRIFALPGSIKILGFANRARMGSYADAVHLAEQNGTIPGTALVRRYAWRPGFALNVAQALTDDLGFFLRASANDGREENYEFTDMNRSVATGLSLGGQSWSRPNDRAGLATETGFLSPEARDYFALGGLGTLIGDGRLHYGPERVLEMFYGAALPKSLALTGDYQFVDHPAYNRDRGPVSIFALRLHGEY